MATSDFKKFSCTTCKQVNYMRRKPAKKGVQQEKMEVKKFCKHCREHLMHKETK